MLDAPDPGTPPAAALIDRLCDEFEREWVTGAPVRIEYVVGAARRRRGDDPPAQVGRLYTLRTGALTAPARVAPADP